MFEMKYYKGKYSLTSEEMEKIQNRVNTLQNETGTNKSINLTLITSYGVTAGTDTHGIQSMLDMNDLFN